MTVAEAIRQAEAALAREGVPTPRLDAEVLLAFVLGTARDLLPARGRDPVHPEGLERFLELIGRRGAARVPLQYLTGVQEFYSLEFAVDRRVLIPRPETELLVEEMIRFARERDPAGRPVSLAADAAGEWEPIVADVGTGSGCVAVAVAANLPRLRVVALDVSSDALQVASVNAARHGLSGRVRCLRSDLLEPIGSGALDAVLSNPPYVAASELGFLQEEVRSHEPVAALVAGASGLEIYERLIPQSARALRPGGLLALELAAGRHEPVRRMLEGSPWEAVALREDFQGFPRVLAARKG